MDRMGTDFECDVVEGSQEGFRVPSSVSAVHHVFAGTTNSVFGVGCHFVNKFDLEVVFWRKEVLRYEFLRASWESFRQIRQLQRGCL